MTNNNFRTRASIVSGAVSAFFSAIFAIIVINGVNLRYFEEETFLEVTDVMISFYISLFLGFIALLISIIVFVVFSCMWIFKAHKNSLEVDKHVLPWNPGVTVGLQFVPLAGWFFAVFSMFKISKAFGGGNLVNAALAIIGLLSVIDILDSLYSTVVGASVIANENEYIAVLSVIFTLSTVLQLFVMHKINTVQNRVLFMKEQ